ncbi:TniB family NTP-binding protein [Clostridium septicum]|uniref:TniB family NTP-binding protein n=1 Tax=Clostridium septicum TaxID=1504 RepID=UPI0013E8E7E4|nr:TniB family NTP-binding protein [Clostridium septicum]
MIIDEIQHLSRTKSGGADKMLNFFTTLVNVGVPIIMVGTMAARDILQSDFRMARRNLGVDGNVIWDRLKMIKLGVINKYIVAISIY